MELSPPAGRSVLQMAANYKTDKDVCSVGMEGIGPSTSVLSGQRSTTELHALNSLSVFDE